MKRSIRVAARPPIDLIVSARGDQPAALRCWNWTAYTGM
jgi:hypothetical protein